MTRQRLHQLSVILLCGLLLGAVPPQRGQRGRQGGRGGNRQGQNGRMESARANAEAKRAKQKEMEQRQQEQKALQKRVSALKKQASVARKRAQAYQKSERSASGSGLLQTFQQQCAKCHTYPDPQSSTDLAWLQRIPVTSCKGAPPKSRDELAKYLASLEGLHPRTITSSAEPARTQVAVTTSLKTGEVLLRNKAGATFRLLWEKGTAGEPRVLPAGVYTLLGYRVVAGPWTIAATGGTRPIMLAPGAPRHIPINTTLKAQVEVQARGENAAVQLKLTGSDGMGVGIYGGGYAIPITYVVLQQKDVVSQGTFRNMGSGQSSTLLRLPEGPPARVQVELPTSLPVPMQGSGVANLPKPKKPGLQTGRASLLAPPGQGAKRRPPPGGKPGTKPARR
jgi:hypothetical protein